MSGRQNTLGGDYMVVTESKTDSGFCQLSKTEIFLNKVDGLKSLIIFKKISIFNILQGPEHATTFVSRTDPIWVFWGFFVIFYMPEYKASLSIVITFLNLSFNNPQFGTFHWPPFKGSICTA